MVHLFKKRKKESHVNTDVLNDILLPSYEISRKHEAKIKAWRKIAQAIEITAKESTESRVKVLDSVYKAIPYEELKDTLELQGYSLQRTGTEPFRKADYDEERLLYIRW